MNNIEKVRSKIFQNIVKTQREMSLKEVETFLKKDLDTVFKATLYTEYLKASKFYRKLETIIEGSDLPIEIISMILIGSEL